MLLNFDKIESIKMIPTILFLIFIGTLNFSVAKEAFEAHVSNTSEKLFNITDFKNNSLESSNLFREDQFVKDIQNYEKDLGGVRINQFVKQVDLKKVQYIYGNEKENYWFNSLLNYKNYELLCLGNISLPTKIQSKLKCRYIDRGIPFLKIAPFKEEEAYLEPRLVIFHDVLYKEEIETIKRLSTPMLEQATFTNPETGEDFFLDARITKTAWLNRNDHKHIDDVNRRTILMTGLSLETAEPLQVAYYPLRGKYEPHYDFEWEVPHATNTSPPFFYDRIATVLFYLNNVEKGGQTVFSKLDVTLTPRTGSAAFWYNLKPNGYRDYLTMHAACPVTSGIKWAANLWIEESWQEFHRPCTLKNQPRDVDWECLLYKNNNNGFSPSNVPPEFLNMCEIQKKKRHG